MATLISTPPFEEENIAQKPILYSPGESARLCSSNLGPNTLSVLSYNLLLPNSVDGWWTFKNYCPNTPMEARSWLRRQALLAKKIQMESPDIMCFQEASDRSYKSDFEFLTTSGWKFHVHAKGKMRMRPITFWNPALFEVVSGASFSKDHTLITPFRVRSTQKIFWTINCHLQAGIHAGDRRLRQLHEALETVRKKSKTLCISSDCVIVCGDFNSKSDEALATGVYLLHGKVDGGFEEYGKSVTSKTKRCSIFPFQDAYRAAYAGNTIPPTMIAPSLIPRMESSRDASAKDGQTQTYKGEVKPSKNFVAACNLLFGIYSDTGGHMMSRRAIEKWLMDINKSVERGDEMRHAFEILEAKGGDGQEDVANYFSPEDFLLVYTKELQHGKYWGIASDFQYIAAKYHMLPKLAELDVLPPFYIEGREPNASEAETDIHLGTIDYIFYTSKTLKCEGVLDISLGRNRPIPDSSECSDHFCIKAVFSFP